MGLETLPIYAYIIGSMDAASGDQVVEDGSDQHAQPTSPSRLNEKHRQRQLDGAKVQLQLRCIHITA